MQQDLMNVNLDYSNWKCPNFNYNFAKFIRHSRYTLQLENITCCVNIYIKGTKYNSENYKPIYLTCICCNLLENIVVSSIMTHANAYNILLPSSMMGFENKDHVKPN